MKRFFVIVTLPFFAWAEQWPLVCAENFTAYSCAVRVDGVAKRIAQPKTSECFNISKYRPDMKIDVKVVYNGRTQEPAVCETLAITPGVFLKIETDGDFLMCRGRGDGMSTAMIQNNYFNPDILKRTTK